MQHVTTTAVRFYLAFVDVNARKLLPVFKVRCFTSCACSGLSTGFEAGEFWSWAGTLRSREYWAS
jgi:hypothetical protein